MKGNQRKIGNIDEEKTNQDSRKTDVNSTNLISQCEAPKHRVVHLSVVGQFTIVVGVDNSPDEMDSVCFFFLWIKTLAPNKYYVTLETQFRPKHQQIKYT